MFPENIAFQRMTYIVNLFCKISFQSVHQFYSFIIRSIFNNHDHAQELKHAKLHTKKFIFKTKIFKFQTQNTTHVYVPQSTSQVYMFNIFCKMAC